MTFDKPHEFKCERCLSYIYANESRGQHFPDYYFNDKYVGREVYQGFICAECDKDSVAVQS